MRFWKPKPPIWETDERQSLPWDEKMAIWRRHRRYSLFLGAMWLVTFTGTGVWWFVKCATGGAGLRELCVVLGCSCVMGLIFFLATRLIE